MPATHPGPYQPPALTEILGLSNPHTRTLTPAGAADCWGLDIYGQAGDVTEHLAPTIRLR